MKDDLIRLEQKVDLIMFALQEAGLMQKRLPNLEGIENDTCALCGEYIKLTVDVDKGELLRSCGCKLPKKAFKLQLITPQPKDKTNADYRNQEDTIPPDNKE